MLVITAIVVLVFRRSGDSRIGRAWSPSARTRPPRSPWASTASASSSSPSPSAPPSPSLAGTVQAHVTYTVTPEQYLFAGPIPPNSAFLLAAVVLGGMGTMSGPLVGAALLFLIPNKLQFLGEYQLLAFGIALILLMRFRPRRTHPEPPPPARIPRERGAPATLTKAGA